MTGYVGLLSFDWITKAWVAPLSLSLDMVRYDVVI